MSTRTSALHVPDVEHAAHEAVHAAAVMGRKVTDVARHEADVVVDAVLSPLAISLDGFEVDITEDDLL